MKSLFYAVSAAALLAGCASTTTTPAPEPATVTAQPAPQAPAFQTYDARQFHETTSFSLSSPSGYGFSPDGTSILVSTDSTGIFNAVALDLDGNTTPLTTATGDSTYAVSYFPADERILVSADSGGNEISHIFVRETDGTLKDLTPGEETRANFVGWHKDGSVFYIATNERDAATDDVYAYKADTYDRELIFRNNGKDIGDMSADGTALALSKERTSSDANIYIADLTAETPTQRLITSHEGDIAYGVYTFTPDGQTLVYATNEYGEFNQAWTYDRETRARKSLIEADWDVSYVSYSPSGKYRVSAINDDGVTRLTLFNTDTNAPVVMSGVPDGELTQVRFNADESRIAFAVNTDTSPRNIYTADLASGEARALTSALPDGINEDDLVTASIVRYESFDGLEIPAIFYVPKQASADNPVPALVWVHGGPGGQSTKGYSAMIQHLVNNGYAVLAANNRGSSGYGKTFFHMDDRRHGEEDLQDIVWGRKYLESLDYIDGEKVGILGGSYGGFMTAAALAFEPEAFEVGVNIFGVTNWVRTMESIPAWWGSFRDALFDEMGDPATDGERHRAISPLFHAENIIRPMLVIQGANDPRVLQVESDELVAAVRANGTPVEYVLFPDEGHGFQKKENRITASEAFVTFLDTYLKGEAETE